MRRHAAASRVDEILEMLRVELENAAQWDVVIDSDALTLLDRVSGNVAYTRRINITLRGVVNERTS